MIDFPANPTVGQVFQGWEWDGVKWISAPSSGGSGGASITVSDTPPPNPSQGALWWESVNGQMYVFYNDGSSSQWTPTTNQMGGGYQPLQGVTDGSSAAAGQIGEVISNVNTTGSSIPASTPQNVVAIVLTAGDWDVQGELWFTSAGATITSIVGALNSISGTLPATVPRHECRASANCRDLIGYNGSHIVGLPRQPDGGDDVLSGQPSKLHWRNRHPDRQDLGEESALMLNFPDNPTVNQVFTSGAQSWTWDGTKWVASGIAQGIYLPLAGGALTGPLSGPFATFSELSAPQAIGANRIINGDMMIDQRGVASAGGGTASGYTVDRWRFYVTANVLNKVQFSRLSASQGGDQQANGIGYALYGSTATAYNVVAADQVGFLQSIEADLLTDIAWGLPNAQSLTLSFMVNAGQAGTYGGAIRNAANTRSYPFTYSVPNAGQWTKIAITIPGDTAGTWTLRGNAAGLNICFDLGSGSTWLGPANAWSNGNYLGAIGQQGIVANLNNQLMFSSVKLELGPVATPFQSKTVQESLADCQRYYQVPSTNLIIAGYAPGAGVGQNDQWIYVSYNAGRSDYNTE